METFKDYSSSVVDSIVEYIRDKSCLKNLDLVVEDVKLDVGSDFYKGQHNNTRYRCKIYNNSLNSDNTIIVTIGLYNDDYTLDIFSSHFHNFGISAFMYELNIRTISDCSVSVDAGYFKELDTSNGIDVVRDVFPDSLLVQSSSYIPTFSLEGTLTLSEKLSYDLALDLVRKFLHRSHLVFDDK